MSHSSHGFCDNFYGFRLQWGERFLHLSPFSCDQYPKKNSSYGSGNTEMWHSSEHCSGFICMPVLNWNDCMRRFYSYTFPFISDSRYILLPVVLHHLHMDLQEQKDLIMCARILSNIFCLIKKNSSVSKHSITSTSYWTSLNGMQ